MLYYRLKNEERRLTNEAKFLTSKKEKIFEEQDELIKSKLKKKDFEIVSDFITTDFHVINDSTLGGYVVRDGGFEYGKDDHGNPIVRYKDGENLKDVYGNLNYAIAYGSRYQDSHYEADNRMIGYWDKFKYIPKGTPGIYHTEEKPDIDENYNRVWARLNTSKDITELSDLSPENLINLPASASYEDLGKGNKQIVGQVYHIAVSLNKNEQDRCSTLQGTPCNVSLIQDHSLIEAESAADNDITINNGVLRADFSQPPTNKKKDDANMGKNKKEEEPKIEEDTVEPTEEEKDMKTTDEGEAPPYEKEEKEPLLEEENESKPKKKDLVEIPIKTFEDLQQRIVQLEESAKRSEDLLSKYKEENEVKEAKDFEELAAVLEKEPYSVPKETIEGKDLAWLKDKKDFLDSLPMIQDFFKEKALTHEDVNKYLFDFEPQSQDPMDLVFNDAQQKGKIALDFIKGEK